MAPRSRPHVAVLTASSTSGAACVDALLAHPDPPDIRAVFRSDARAAPLRKAHPAAPNLQIVVGADAARPDTLVPALAGCSVAFLVTPHDPARGIAHDAALVANMMNAAVDARVSHIIFGASWTANFPNHMPLIASRFLPGEALLRNIHANHRVTWTVLRGGFFYDNYLQLCPALKHSDELCFPNFCAPANDPADIGRAAAAVALSDGLGHHGKTYEISGPEYLWMTDIARILSDVLGRNIRFIETPVEQTIAVMPPFLQQLFLYLCERARDAVPFSSDVASVTGRLPVSFRDWVTLHKHEFDTI